MDRHVLAQITFGNWRAEAGEEWLRGLDDAFHGLMGCLLRSGQIIGETPYGVVEGELRVFVRLPQADSLERQLAENDMASIGTWPGPMEQV